MEFAKSNGTGLRYALSGKGERTLVLVHEVGGSLESWDDVARRFVDSRKMLRYDCRGAGLSQKVRGELAIDTMADDIAALLDHNGIAGKVALAALPLAARSRCTSPPANRSAPAQLRSVAPPPDRRAAVLERVARIEAEGMAFAVEG